VDRRAHVFLLAFSGRPDQAVAENKTLPELVDFQLKLPYAVPLNFSTVWEIELPVVMLDENATQLRPFAALA
jgi:hypothetical protein